MIDIVKEKEGDERSFILKSSVGIQIKRPIDKNKEHNALLVYKKSDKKQKTIAIIQADDKIDFKEIKESGVEGIKFKTNKDADFSSLQMVDKTIFLFSGK